MKKSSGKEAALFDRAVDQFEEGHYSRSLKTTLSILKRKPKHAEAIALEGLNLCKLEKHQDALLKCRLATSLNAKSRFCWQALAITYRDQKDYLNSLNCYKNAVNLSPKNEGLLYDTAYIQFHLGLYAALVQSWLTLVGMDSENLEYRLCLTLSYYLSGSFDHCLAHCIDLLSSHKLTPNVASRLACFIPKINFSQGLDFEVSFSFLQTYSSFISSSWQRDEQLASLCFRFHKFDKTLPLYAKLIVRNPDKNEYTRRYLESLYELTINKGLPRDVLYRKSQCLLEWFPNAMNIKVLILQFLVAVNLDYNFFLEHILTYSTSKGIPSTILLLKPLIKDDFSLAHKIKEALLFQLVNTNKKNPTAQVWNLYYLSYLAYFTLDYTSSLYWINQAITDLPTLPDLYYLKGKILSRLGEWSDAIHSLTFCTELDKGDRALASRLAKTYFYIDETELAYKSLSKFCKDRFGGVPTYLAETECIWFLIEDGESLLRQQSYGLALKRFHQLFNIFKEWSSLSFSYHTYCAENAEFEQYLEMCDWITTLWDSPTYLRVALGATIIYLDLYKSPYFKYGKSAPAVRTMNEFEQIQFEKDQNQSVGKLHLQEESRLKRIKLDEDEDPFLIDHDLFGMELLNTKDPLQEAMKFLYPLRLNRLKGWGFLKYLASKIYKIKGKV
ncbi:NatA N-acetyltransferase complex subunit [Schizosaccharomyces cryophilus OY26]|uniref:NatA N-acetyltransferase complex subunit n=1 Tax=Schizosaccharomyces cryophilus (strain OY26 / ATCC MYA-4695 / CBS 11777 / NBRC 106824 / NRRL Y48691) TaxID=653667 RepID=S9XJC6_SCHCR|nr:NatA N-acetyltransferase complex subunit [Schizosaccharomyces cryophilus OY26]EPY53746.1 NatA N-acetyltransferase complex subunit [Schizosaccharomyces cryophilus OY26]